MSHYVYYSSSLAPLANFRSSKTFCIFLFYIFHSLAQYLHLTIFYSSSLTREELQAGKPIIGIAQSGSDLSPCNRHHLTLATRIRDGIRVAGGIPIEFPTHPIQETGKRPTAALDRNLAYLSLVEVLHGYPIDAVVLLTGCDKTTPACLMAAATVNIPAIVLNVGPMLNGYWKNKLAGSGTVIWQCRKDYAAGNITLDDFMENVSSSAPSLVIFRFSVPFFSVVFSYSIMQLVSDIATPWEQQVQ